MIGEKSKNPLERMLKQAYTAYIGIYEAIREKMVQPTDEREAVNRLEGTAAETYWRALMQWQVVVAQAFYQPSVEFLAKENEARALFEQAHAAWVKATTEARKAPQAG